MSLFSPLTFRTGLTARNRVVLAPMTNKQSHDDGSLGDDELRWLSSRAEGGFGVVMTCAAHVAKDGQGWPGELGIFDDALLPGLATLAAALRQRGAVSMVQIFHGGLRADPAVSGTRPWSASAGDGVREATPDDLARVVEQFAAAAARAERAGFDGVELHGAHGYLFTQFLSAEQNRRTDRGAVPSSAGRDCCATLCAPCAPASRRRSPSACGCHPRTSATPRVSISTRACRPRGGWPPTAPTSCTCRCGGPWTPPPSARPSTRCRSSARRCRPRSAILAAGTLWTRDEAEQVMALGADAVALGRSAIVNRDWPLRARDGAWQPRRPPVTFDDLRREGLSDAFAGYMRSWKGFVEEG